MPRRRQPTVGDLEALRSRLTGRWPDTRFVISINHERRRLRVVWTDGPGLARVGAHARRTVILERARSAASVIQDLLDGHEPDQNADARVVTDRAQRLAAVMVACGGASFANHEFLRARARRTIAAAGEHPDTTIEIWARLCDGDDHPAAALEAHQLALLAVAADLDAAS